MSLILIVAALVGICLYYWQVDRREGVGKKVIHTTLVKTYAQVLEKYFAYYRQLPAAQKEEFSQRVDKFLAEKEFVSRGKLEITEEMKILVAACAIQLSFGLSPVYLSHFKMIILYPDKYYSVLNRDFHVGEVNEGGAIVLSWRHFVEGYYNPTDALNVGLHEMAHALLLENLQYGKDFLDPAFVQEFYRQAKHEYRKIQAGQDSVLRKYAGTNAAELFAVAVETFFENPVEMLTAAPELYHSMQGLLKQNPLRHTVEA